MIYVKFGRQPSLKKFLTLLFSTYNSSGFLTCVETFSDKDCKFTQCKENKYRSIDDILEIVNTYYPSVTIKRLCKVLFNLELLQDNKHLKLYSLYCDNIKRTTMLFTPQTCEYKTELKGGSKWSTVELFIMSKL